MAPRMLMASADTPHCGQFTITTSTPRNSRYDSVCWKSNVTASDSEALGCIVKRRLAHLSPVSTVGTYPSNKTLELS